MEKRSLKKNIFLNTCKEVISLLFPLITVPYVSQHLGAELYGAYSFSASIIAYATLIATMGITTYAIREGAKIRDDSAGIQKLTSELLSINVFFTVLAYAAIGIILFIPRFEPYRIYILILSITIICDTLGMEWINQIYEDYLYLTIRYIIIQIAYIVLLFVFVKTREDIIKYCVVIVTVSASTRISSYFHIRKYAKPRLIRKCNFHTHLKPMLVFFVSSLSIMIYVNADITMLGIYKGDVDVGIYSFASKIYNIIKVLLYTIISTSIPRITKYLKENYDQYKVYLGKIFLLLSIVTLPVSIGLLVLSKDTILILGKVEYVSGALSLSIISCAIPFAIFGAFFSNLILIVHSHEKIMLIGTAISAITNVALNFYFIPVYGIEGAAVTTVIAEIISASVSFAYALRHFKKAMNFEFRGLFISVIESILIVLGYIILNKYITNDTIAKAILRALLLMGYSVVVYLVLLLFGGKTIKELLRQMNPINLFKSRKE